MPGSNSHFDRLIIDFILNINVEKFIDIGPGFGKYGKIMKHYKPDVKRIGVEIEPDYIENFKLKDIYDEVLCMPGIGLIDNKLDETYDVAIIGDCIEHMRKSEGIDLINFLVYRCKYLLVVYPIEYLQGTCDGYKYEAHISVWSEHDFKGFDYMAITRGEMRLFAINGYLQNKEKDPGVKLLADIVNAHNNTLAK